jgi:hypothetical protein
MTKTAVYQDFQHFKEKLSDQPNKITAFFLPVIVLLAIFFLFGEYLAKHGKIHVYTIMKSNSRCKGHKSSYSTKHRLIQKYVHAFMFSCNKSQQAALFLNFILVKNSTCFGQTYFPSPGDLILYSQQLVFVILVVLTV